jgi:HEAT repeat protein
MRAAFLLLSLFAAACGATEARPDPGSVRPLAELPPEHAELWSAWTRNAPDWRARQRAAQADPELTAFLVDNLVRTLLRGLQRGEFTTLDSQALGPFERARAELVVLGTYATPALAELLALGNGQGPSLAADLLLEIGRPSVMPLLAQLERAENDQARQRAADLLARLPHAHQREPEVRARLIAHLERDPSWLVRKLCARALGERGARDVELDEARTALMHALVDGDSEVARAAALGLARLADPAAIPALVNYLQRSMVAAHLAGQQTAQKALLVLSGEQKARDPRGWRAWWRDHRPPPRGALKPPDDGGR